MVLVLILQIVMILVVQITNTKDAVLARPPEQQLLPEESPHPVSRVTFPGKGSNMALCPTHSTQGHAGVRAHSPAPF